MIIGIIPLFFLELFVSMKVGDIIGFLPSIVWILGTMFIGTLLLRFSPYAFMGNLASVQMGKLDPKSANALSMSYLLGSILLIVPGVITDFLGLSFLLYALYLHLLAKIRPQKYVYNQKNKGDDDVIDVEVIDE